MIRTIQLKRLTRSADFRRVRAGRRSCAMPGVVMQARPQVPDARGLDPAIQARVGFTVSKKVGNAVERNRAKRRLRAAAADVLTAMATPGMDYVLIGRRQTLDRPYDSLKQDLAAALSKLGMRRDQEGAQAQ